LVKGMECRTQRDLFQPTTLTEDFVTDKTQLDLPRGASKLSEVLEPRALEVLDRSIGLAHFGSDRVSECVDTPAGIEVSKERVFDGHPGLGVIPPFRGRLDWVAWHRTVSKKEIA